MAEPETSGNVFPIISERLRTATRQRRPRKAKAAKPKQATAKEKPAAPAPVPLIAPSPAVASEPVFASTPALVSASPRRSRLLDAAALVAAIALAGVSAWFSITGMVAIFPGAALAVIAMAAAMEGGKLAGAAWLAAHWQTTGALLRVVLTTLVGALAVINATGVYSQLSAAHMMPQAVSAAAIDKETASLKARVETQGHVIADLDRRIGQIDLAIEEAARRGRSRGAMTLADEQRRTRDALVSQRQQQAVVLVGLKAEEGRVAAQARLNQADIGALNYAATLAGLDAEQSLRLLILGMVLSCDPMSIVLLVAVARARRRETDAVAA